jgi:hypothetical protein
LTDHWDLFFSFTTPHVHYRAFILLRLSYFTMPRRTRAALRTNVILEDDAGVAGTAPLPAAPRQERAPLGEIAGNVAEETLTVLEVNLSKPAKKAALAKKATGAKRGRKAKTVTPESMGEVLEDEYQSSANSAVDEACRDLLRERRGGKQTSAGAKTSSAH